MVSTRWRMLALGWLAYCAFGMAVGSLAPLVSPIMGDLGLSSGRMGLVLGVWQLVYVFTAIPLGVAVDRLGVRRSVALALAVIILSLLLRAAATSFWTLLASVALFGVGGPVVSIGVPKIVAEWFPPRERGRAAGFYTTAPTIGAVVVLATAAGVLLRLVGSWRLVMLVFAVAGVGALLLWTLGYRDPPAGGTSAARPAPAARMRGRWLVLLREPNMRLLLVLAVGTFAVNHALNAWQPTYLEEVGFTLAAAGRWTAVGTLCGLLTALVVPGLSRPGARRAALAALLLAAALGLAGMMALRAGPLLAASWVTAMARAPVLPLMMLLLMEQPGVGARHLGLGAGLLFAAAEIGGFGGPALLGAVRDLAGGLAPAMLGMAGMSLLMIVTILRVRESTE
ncbi:MAG: MFS transporter [Spirochaetaceae bacterium]|nr:MFS transporter [Spirochaetaceae bacterium]